MEAFESDLEEEVLAFELEVEVDVSFFAFGLLAFSGSGTSLS